MDQLKSFITDSFQTLKSSTDNKVDDPDESNKDNGNNGDDDKESTTKTSEIDPNASKKRDIEDVEPETTKKQKLTDEDPEESFKRDIIGKAVGRALNGGHNQSNDGELAQLD